MIVRADQADEHPPLLRFRLAFDGVRRLRPAERQSAIADGGRLDSGNIAHAPEHAFGERNPLLVGGIALRQHLQADHQDAVGLESGIDVLQFDESADRQAGPHQ